MPPDRYVGLLPGDPTAAERPKEAPAPPSLLPGGQPRQVVDLFTMSPAEVAAAAAATTAGRDPFSGALLPLPPGVRADRLAHITGDRLLHGVDTSLYIHNIICHMTNIQMTRMICCILVQRSLRDVRARACLQTWRQS